MENEKKTVVTREDYDRMSAELNDLLTRGRDEAAERIKVARSFGDLSENAEYDEAMNDQAKMEARIATLKAQLDNVEILDEASVNSKVIHVGSEVTVLDIEMEEETTYKILGKSDLDQGIISDSSPLGAALIGKKSGQVVDVHVPGGAVVQYKIVKIHKSKK